MQNGHLQYVRVSQHWERLKVSLLIVSFQHHPTKGKGPPFLTNTQCGYDFCSNLLGLIRLDMNADSQRFRPCHFWNLIPGTLPFGRLMFPLGQFLLGMEETKGDWAQAGFVAEFLGHFMLFGGGLDHFSGTATVWTSSNPSTRSEVRFCPKSPGSKTFPTLTCSIHVFGFSCSFPQCLTLSVVLSCWFSAGMRME